MPWKEYTVKEIAEELGVDIEEIEQKQVLIKEIVRARKLKGWSQVLFAKKLGITQGRVAQIENGVSTANISFEILFSALKALGLKAKININKAA